LRKNSDEDASHTICHMERDIAGSGVMF
jgi:hypothetical protein